MTTTILPNTDVSAFGAIGPDGLLKKLGKDGRFPPVKLVVRPLVPDAAGNPNIQGALTSPSIVLDRFLSYTFSSSVLVPVDTFSFAFVAPDGAPLYEVIKDGDLVSLTANDVPLSTGIIDAVETETDREYGEKGSLTGRDLMSQLEDQDAVSLDSSIVYTENTDIRNAVMKLAADTRITNFDFRDVPFGSNWLLSTEAGESKLAALQRFIDPFNILAWMRPDGVMIVGKPNMSQTISGSLLCSREKRLSNVLSIKVTRASTTIPNAIVAIYNGQQNTQTLVGKQQILYNGTEGPSRLFQLGHRVPKSVIVSIPTASNAQDLADINLLELVASGGGSLLQAYAKREIARRNTQQIIVQAVVPGHFNDSGMPYIVDTCYYVEYDRGSVAEVMYLYQTDYSLSVEGGQITTLYLCRLGTIVADIKAF